MPDLTTRGAPAAAVSEVGPLVRRWLQRASAVIAASAPALNAINVFPVSDSDTGSNVALTLAGVETAIAARDGFRADEIAQAAILSAHGNSGAIVAEVVAQVVHELAAPGVGASDSAGVRAAGLLRTAARAAASAVAQPVAGTILTVADAAADAAARVATDPDEDALAVARAALAAARAALADTTALLPVLADAGVVDAGGQAYVLLLEVVVECLGGPPAQALTAVDLPLPAVERHGGAGRLGAELAYEVMYTLRGVEAAELAGLRTRLADLGDSVVVIGDQSVAQVHVHLSDAGAAIEAGLALGRLDQVRINALPPAAEPSLDPGERAVVAVVAGPGLADAVTALGGVAVVPADSHVSPAELRTALDQASGDVILLPNDMECLEVATHLAAQLRSPRRRIAVIPTVAQIQGLAAMAVHEPTADFDSAVVAMISTAGHARHGAVTIAESSAMTMAGRCEAGDVLGLADGDFVEIGASVPEVAWNVVRRLVDRGESELVTLVSGADADPAIVSGVADRVRSALGLEVEVVAGGQRRYPVLVGVE